MYTEFFGLNEKPFSISPDPRYLYLSRRHADALAHLIYGISESGGFIQLTGEVGTGKTTLIRSLLEQLPEKADIALILNPQLSTREFLRSICQELGADEPADDSIKSLIDVLNAKLLEAHTEDRRVVLIVDEAQTLSPELLEQIRLLTNLETAKRKLLQIILIGQPELRGALDQPEMRQIAQRITGRYHLEPLNAKDANVYIKHRMRVAGAQTEVFTDRAMRRIFKLSGGIPRLINVIADRSLLAAYTQDRRRVGSRLVQQAANEVFGGHTARRWWPWAAVMTSVALLALVTTSVVDLDVGDVELMLAARDASSPNEPTAPPDVEGQDTDEIDAVADTEEGPRVKLGALLSDATTPMDEQSAAAELFRQWQIEFRPDAGPPCDQAASFELRCLYLPGGSIRDLRRLDRPAVLLLGDDAGQERQLVVSGIGYDVVELSAGGRKSYVDIAELTHYWVGDLWLLWRPVLGSGDVLSPGDRSELVPWLRERLAALIGETPPAADPLLYDAALADSVRQYQAQNRLVVDGMVGAQTQIALQTALDGHDAPRIVEAF